MESNSGTILEGLFDSEIKVKLLKLFLQNEEDKFTLDDITERTQSDSSSVRYQLRKLREIDLVESALVRFPSKQEDKEKGRKRRVYFVSQEFPLFAELKNLITKTVPIEGRDIKNRIERLGEIKLAVLTGVFQKNESAPTDMFVVGEELQKEKLQEEVDQIEAKLGKELRFTTMSTDEFEYRVDMFDNFLKQIFKNPHEIIIKEMEIPF